MQPKTVRVLIAAAHQDDAALLRGLLQETAAARFETEAPEHPGAVLERLKAGGVDILLLDFSLPAGQGPELFGRIQREYPDLPVVVLSRVDDEHAAMKAVHAGAQDYLVKSRLDGQLLARSIRYAIERLQSRAAVAAAEGKYRSIFENSPKGIFQTSPDGRYLSANPALAKIYGYSAPEELMNAVTDIGHQLYVRPERRDEFIRLIQEKEEVRDFESQVRRRDGGVIWISENARAVRNRLGRIQYFEGMVEDVTERKRAEERVRASETRFRSIWESTVEGMRLTNAEGIIMDVNPSYCRIVGMTREELIGQPYTAIYANKEAHKEMMDRYRDRFAQRRIEPRLERRLVFLSGKTVDLESFNSYVEMEQGTWLLAVFHDITARKQAEERERQASFELARSREELREKNETMQEDLRMAREVQMAILPQEYPTFPASVPPEKSLLRFSHYYRPQQEVSGDFFTVLPVSQTRAGMFICDVMGHGVRSALITTMVRGLVEELCPVASEPDALMARVNRDLQLILQQTGTPLFTTAFYLLADLETRTFSFVNAAHPPPVLIHMDGRAEFLRPAQGACGPALGLFPESSYAVTTAGLLPGDVLLFYTDGLCEAENEAGSQFNGDMLLAAAGRHAGVPPDRLLERLMKDVTGFAGSKGFGDDVCLVAMEVAKPHEFHNTRPIW